MPIKSYEGYLSIEERTGKSGTPYKCVVFLTKEGDKEVVLGYYDLSCRVAITLL